MIIYLKKITQNVLSPISKFHFSKLGIANNILIINIPQKILGKDNISFLVKIYDINQNNIIITNNKYINNIFSPLLFTNNFSF